MRTSPLTLRLLSLVLAPRRPDRPLCRGHHASGRGAADHLFAMDRHARPLAMDPMMRLKPPSEEHLLGTDGFGRDLFSRMILAGASRCRSGSARRWWRWSWRGDRAGRRLFPAGRCHHHARHGRADGDAPDPDRDRAGGAERAVDRLGHHRHHHPRDAARGAAGALGRADRARGTLCRAAMALGSSDAEDPVPAPVAEHHGADDRAGHLCHRPRRS